MRTGYKVSRQDPSGGDKNNTDNILQSSTTRPQTTASKITFEFNKHLSDSLNKTLNIISFAEVASDAGLLY